MITKNVLTVGIAVAFLTAGCATTRVVVKAEPTVMQASNEYFEATATPKCGSYGCEAFMLQIKNKTDKNLEVNWNKTLYITRGQTSGGFMFEGVLYKDRNNPKSPDIIFGNGTLSKTIWPNNLVDFYSRWRNEDMPSGENGIYLTVDVDGKEISQKLVTNISVTRIQQR